LNRGSKKIYKILVGKPPGRLGRRWEDNIQDGPSGKWLWR